MVNCEHCRDRLLDFVFGLLEGTELQETRDHLAGCAECQAALEMAQGERKLLARAAQAITQVPEFALPSAKPGAETIPMAPAFKPSRSMWRRPWVAWSAAAAVLIAVGASFSAYRHTVASHEQVIAEKRKEHKEIAEQFTALPVKYRREHEAAVAKVRGDVTPYLHVVGPTTLQPGAKGHLHITAIHPEGTPRQVKEAFARANLRVKLAEAGHERVMRPECDEDGRAVAEFDAGKTAPGGKLSVIVEADTGSAKARIQEAVQVAEPTFVTRIDTNKIAYRVKDVLFFRILVLDRYSLHPPGPPIPMRVELLDPQGKAVRSLVAPTGAGGILAREFAIDEKVADGNYTLHVQPVDAAKTPVQPASQRLEIVRELRLPDFQFDQDRYLPGDQVTGVYRGAQPLAKQALIGNEKVALNVLPMAPVPAPAPGGFMGMTGGGPLPAPAGFGGGFMGGAGGGPAFAPGAGTRFATQIPRNLPTGANRVEMTIPVQNGKKKSASLRAEIPLAPTDFTIDFFPEGGDLIAGVANRVFYRVRSKSGDPVTGDGQVVLLTSKNDIVDSSYALGMGYLDFIPHPKETYTVRITTPAKTQNLSAPFAKLIRPEGVVIQVASLDEEHAPSAVGRQGDPIRLTLRQQGPSRKLLLVAQCRGQVVDQRWVDLKRDPVAVTLFPTQEAVGMIRVTAYEIENNILQPLAERLVYRTAAQRLNLGVALNTQQINAGKSVTARISARDEKGQPASTWLLASVVDERYQNRPRSLSAHFLLLNEIRTGADLDNAQLILHDSAESTQVLERFLGTNGWRRHVRAEELAAKRGGAAQTLVFSRQNRSLDDVQKEYEDNLAQTLSPLHRKGFAEELELEDRRDRAAEAIVLAVADLRQFEELVQVWIRVGMGTLLASLLAASLILMGVGAYRILRDQKAATPAFGASFACLAGCLGLIFLATMLGSPTFTAPPSLAAAHGPPAWKVKGDITVIFGAGMPAVQTAPARAPSGPFALARIKPEGELQVQANAARSVNEQDTKDASRALRDQLAHALVRRGDAKAIGGFGGPAKQDRVAGNDALRAVYDKAKKLTEGAAADTVPPPSAQGAKGGSDKGKGDFAYRGAIVYAPQYKQGLQADTLLWHPALWLDAGHAEVRFDLADGNATYRILLLGHGPTGRFGFFERRLDVLGR